jgi:GH15 family glucan-1,4-alpha-glucosidase
MAGNAYGYQSSRPVHIGNGAYSQLQLDIYGELMDKERLTSAPFGWLRR